MDMPLALLNRRRRGGASFEKTLFSVPGSRGFFYDLSDYSTMFSDTAGTTAITGVGQSLGLVLDKSAGLALGPELVANGDFSSGLTGWTLIGVGNTSAVSGGVAQITGTTSPGLRRSGILTVGRTYRVSLRIRRTAGSAAAFYTPPLLSAPTLTGDWQTVNYYGVATAVDFEVGLSGTATGTTLEVDDISVRELPGNHATQATAGSRALTQVRPMGVTPRNLLTFSEAFDNAAWTKVNVTATANGAVAPNETTTADVVAATADGQAYIRQNAAVIANTPYTVSIYLKAGNVSWCLFEVWNSGVTKWSGRYINLATGAFGGTTSGGGGLGGVFAVTNIGSGWYRVSVTATSDNTVLTPALYVADGDGDINVLAGNNILLWGAQLELGSTASTYQPTGPALINGEKRNLLTFTEQFDNLAWAKQANVTVTPNAGNDPNGALLADQLNFAATTNDSIFQSVTFSAGQTCTFSVYVKGTVGQTIQVSVQHTSGGNTFTPVTFDGSWQRVSATATASVGGFANLVIDSTGATPAATCLVWGAQVELGPTPTAYQRVVSTDEWYEPGFTSYRGIRFDGSDDFLQTAAIDFAGAESLGPELVTNGDFSVGTGWTLGTGVTISGGVANLAAGSLYLEQGITTVAGRSYKVTATASNGAFCGAWDVANQNNVLSGSATTRTGTFSFTFTANDTQSFIAFTASGAGATTIDNVSVKEVLIPADKMTVVAGVRKLSDAATAAIVELGTNSSTASNSFGIQGPSVSGANRFNFNSSGSAGPSVAAITSASFNAPVTAVLAGLGDISGDSAILRANGASAATSSTDQGTGNYANAAVYIGRRAGSSVPFNGILTFLCVINRTLTASELAQLETFANSRTGAY